MSFLFHRFVLLTTCWFASGCSLFLALTSFLVKIIFRDEGNKKEIFEDCQSEEQSQEEADQDCSSKIQVGIAQSQCSVLDSIKEEEREEFPKLFFKFQFQTYREDDYKDNLSTSLSSDNLSSNELTLVHDHKQNNSHPSSSKDSDSSAILSVPEPLESEKCEVPDEPESVLKNEEISIKSDSVDLGCDPEEVTHGFLLESDFEDRPDKDDSTVIEEDNLVDESRFNLDEQGDETEEPYDWANAEELDAYDSEEDSGDILWEEQDFLEQLKMDLKKARSTGLPKISEEDEYPKVIEIFKPWKIDDKFRHEDQISELHKFYRIYKERMRKLDILNYQKRIAIDCCQAMEVQQTFCRKKGPSLWLGFLLPAKFMLCRSRISASDSMANTIRDLHSEFETIYAAQLCLSWEILHWQYEKVMELWEYDNLGIHRYNEVAGEFQQFQVLLQRFVENERFDGPRVENYTSKRHSSRKLLQVPVIRGDKSKNRNSRGISGSDAVKSDELIEIMEGAIRTFWKFVKADPFTCSLSKTPALCNQVEPNDPAAIELLAETRLILSKKEKRLREVIKNGNGCVLGKLQKQERDNSDHALCFFSEVNMKLVRRVLNMSKITGDQLAWCRNKVDSINFNGRQIQVEPTFCLFPC